MCLRFEESPERDSHSARISKIGVPWRLRCEVKTSVSGPILPMPRWSGPFDEVKLSTRRVKSTRNKLDQIGGSAVGSRIAIAGFHEGLAGQVSSWFGLALKGRELVAYLHPEPELPAISPDARSSRASNRFVFPLGDTYRGLPIIYGDDWPAKLKKAGVREIICALPNPEDRSILYETSRRHGFAVPSIIHPSAVVLSGVRIGEGSIIEPLSYIGIDVEVGICSHLHAGAQIDHNSVLGDYVTVNPGAVIAGNVRIGGRSTINMGATISNGVFLGERTVVGASAFVASSFPDQENRLYGIPARQALR